MMVLDDGADVVLTHVHVCAGCQSCGCWMGLWCWLRCCGTAAYSNSGLHHDEGQANGWCCRELVLQLLLVMVGHVPTSLHTQKAKQSHILYQLFFQEGNAQHRRKTLGTPVRSAALKGLAGALPAAHWRGQSCCSPWRPSQPTVPRPRPLWPPASRPSSSLHGPSAALCGVTPACPSLWIHASSTRLSTAAFASAGDCQAAAVLRDCLVANPQPAALRHESLQMLRSPFNSLV